MQVEWRVDGQRFQRSLRTVAGDTILDKRQARAIADGMSQAMERDHNENMNRVLFGVNPDRTLGQLFGEMHRNRQSSWSKQHRRDQERYRDWWLKKLGNGRIVNVSAAQVEAIAQREADDRDWSPRTHGAYLRYVVDAFTFAERKLKWIEQRHNLSAVDIPSPNSRGIAYERDEVPKLLRALVELGPVPGWLGHTLWQSGRRLSAARTLPKAVVEVEDARSVVLWPRETDKARKHGVSALVGTAHALTAQLMDAPGRYVTGTEPPSMDDCQAWMLEAERRADVKHKKGRLWHGLKRRYADVTEGMKGRSSQSGTREDTLARVYDPRDDVDAAEAVARKLASEVD